MHRPVEPRYTATLVSPAQSDKKRFHELHPNMMISKVMNFTPAKRFFLMAAYVLASVLSLGLFVGLDFAFNYQNGGAFKKRAAPDPEDWRKSNPTYRVTVLPPILGAQGCAGNEPVSISESDDDSDDVPPPMRRYSEV